MTINIKYFIFLLRLKIIVFIKRLLIEDKLVHFFKLKLSKFRLVKYKIKIIRNIYINLQMSLF